MSVRLSTDDQAMLDGQSGEAARFAMSVLARMAEVTGAEELLSVEQAHIDACGLMSQSSLEFIEHLANHDGRVRIPTTLNMIPLDLRNWRHLGVPAAFGEKASRIVEAYLKIGCIPTYTCAPYQGYLTPRFGQQIAWGESNAVVYANSVLGARTNRYGDYMDVCAAITGRAPKVGLHLRENRRGKVLVRIKDVPMKTWQSPAAWATLGHLVGAHVGNSIPVIEGLPQRASSDQLKAFGAAAASSGAVALFHAVGITPEAPDLVTAFHGYEPEETVDVSLQMLRHAWQDLSSVEQGDRLDAVILGCPHFSYSEFEALIRGITELHPNRVHSKVQMLVFTNASAYALAERRGFIESLESFGATVVLDTCPFHSPIIMKGTHTVMTNSGKCAYYAPGELGVNVAFGNLRDCVRSASRGAVTCEDTI